MQREDLPAAENPELSRRGSPPLLFRKDRPSSPSLFANDFVEAYAFFSSILKNMDPTEDAPLTFSEFIALLKSNTLERQDTENNTPHNAAKPKFSPIADHRPIPFIIQVLFDGQYRTLASMLANGNINLNIKDAAGYSFMFYLMRLAPPPFIHLILNTPTASISVAEAFLIELHLAQQSNDFHIIAHYVALGLNLNFVDQAGLSPLTRVLYAQNLPLIEQLLLLGADPNFCIPGTHSPLSHAYNIGNPFTIELLQFFGASLNKHDSSYQASADFHARKYQSLCP